MHFFLKYRWRFPVLLLLLVLASTQAAALEVPPLKGRVNDYADMLSPATVKQLSDQLAALERTDSTQIVVLTINSLQGDPIEDFSIRVAEKWGIGQKGKDNGAILLISQKDRKMRIEVGYGLEGKLTDLMSGQIIRNVITPEFKAGRFDQGVIEGVNAMIGAVRGEYTATRQPRRNPGNASQGMFFALIVFAVLVAQIGRLKLFAGTAAGGVLLPIFGSLFFPGGLMLALILIPVGLGAGLVLSLIGTAMGAASGSSTGHYHGGGYWGGGFSSGGGGGFGGFSGGGGGFGGGGASGGW